MKAAWTLTLGDSERSASPLPRAGNGFGPRWIQGWECPTAGRPGRHDEKKCLPDIEPRFLSGAARTAFIVQNVRNKMIIKEDNI